MVTKENKIIFINNLKSIEMKILIIILSAIGFLSLNSCNQKTDPSAMLENSETRTELFDAIASNHDYMTEFMGNMQGNNHAMQMMQGNKKIMGTVMQGGGMKMMMKDSMMMKNMVQGITGNMQGRQSMMNEMMKDGKMMGNMIKMMHEKGMMSEDCMESCKKMIEESELEAIKRGELELSKSQSHGNHH